MPIIQPIPQDLNDTSDRLFFDIAAFNTALETASQNADRYLDQYAEYGMTEKHRQIYINQFMQGVDISAIRDIVALHNPDFPGL